MTTTDDRRGTQAFNGAGGRHRRDDRPPEGILADAVDAWRARRNHRRRRSGAAATNGTAKSVVAKAAGDPSP